jgi:F-type H+-transporting ATPase subunit b
MLATLTALAAEAAEKKTVNPVLPTSNELVYGAIFFFLLLVFMWAVCLPPIRKAMRQRDEQIQADQEAGERALAEAEQVRRDYDATLAEARAEAHRIVEEAREAADARRAEILGAVETEIADARQAAMAEIEAQRAAALAELTGEVAGIATQAASQVVQRQLDPGAQRSVVDAYVNQAISSR